MASFNRSGLSSTNSSRCQSSSKNVYSSTPNLSNKGSIPSFSGASSIKGRSKKTAEKSDANVKLQLKASLLNPKNKIVLHSKEAGQSNRGPVRALKPGNVTLFRRADNEGRTRLIERNVLEAQYLQSMFLSLTSQQTLIKQEKELMSQTEKLWAANNELVKRIDEAEKRKRKAQQAKSLQSEISAQIKFISEATENLDAIDKQLKFTFNEMVSKNEQLVISGIKVDTKNVEDILNHSSNFDEQQNGNDKIVSSLCKEIAEYCTELNKSIELRKDSMEIIKSFKQEMLNKEKLVNTKKAICEGVF